MTWFFELKASLFEEFHLRRGIFCLFNNGIRDFRIEVGLVVEALMLGVCRYIDRMSRQNIFQEICVVDSTTFLFWLYLYTFIICLHALSAASHEQIVVILIKN